MAAYDKKVNLEQFSEEKLKDPKILSLMKRVRISAQRDLTELNEKDKVCLPGRVIVKTRDGRIFKHQLEYAKDTRGNRASRTELQEKFMELSSPYIGESRTQKIIELVYDLEGLNDISKVTRLCRPNNRR